VGRLKADELGLVMSENEVQPVQESHVQDGWRPVAAAAKKRPAPSLFAKDDEGHDEGHQVKAQAGQQVKGLAALLRGTFSH
jgi:hypothetical protein